MEINQMDQGLFQDCLGCENERENASLKSIQMDIASCISWTTNVPVKSFSRFIKTGRIQALKVIESLEKVYYDTDHNDF